MRTRTKPAAARIEVRLPEDWLPAIDDARCAGTEGELSVADWIRDAILRRLGRDVASKLSDVRRPGRPWPQKEAS